MREVTTLSRAMTDAAAQAAHPNIAFDPGVYETDDIYNRGPDSIFRVIEGAIPQQGVNPIEVIKLPGPDPTVQSTIDYFKTNVDDISGVGVGIQGASAAEISDTRLDKDSAGAIQKQSTQLLNYMARQYAFFMKDLMTKLLNTAIKGGASSSLLMIKDKWNELDPRGWQPRSDAVLDLDIGVNDAQEKLNKALGIQTALGLLTGQPDPQTGEVLGVTAELMPSAGYEIGKLILEAHGAKDLVHKVLMDPGVKEDPQVQAVIETEVAKVEAAAQQQIAAMEEQLRKQIQLEMNAQEKAAENAIKERAVALDERKQDFTEEEAAFKVAISDDAEDRREDESAMDSANKDRALDIQEKKIDNDKELKVRELESMERIAEKAQEAKATAVVSP